MNVKIHKNIPQYSFLAVFLIVKCFVIWIYLKDQYPNLSYRGVVLLDVGEWKSFWSAIHQGALPYINLSKEYPVLLGFFYWVISPFIDTSNQFQTLLIHSLVMGILDLVAALLFHDVMTQTLRLGAWQSWGFTALFSFNATNLILSPFRHEGMITCVVLLALLAQKRSAKKLSTALWAVGASMKWYPGFFFLTELSEEFKILWKQHKVRAIRTSILSSLLFAAVATLIHLPFVAVSIWKTGTINTILESYVFHMQRHVSIDTVPGIWALWFGVPFFERLLPWSSGLLMVGAALFLPTKLKFEGRMVIICIVGLLFNIVYSPQFNLWFYPFLILLIAQEKKGRRMAWLILFFAVDLINISVFPVLYCETELEGYHFHQIRTAVANGSYWGCALSALVIARTVILIMIIRLVFIRGRKVSLIVKNEGKVT